MGRNSFVNSHCISCIHFLCIFMSKYHSLYLFIICSYSYFHNLRNRSFVRVCLFTFVCFRAYHRKKISNEAAFKPKNQLYTKPNIKRKKNLQPLADFKLGWRNFAVFKYLCRSLLCVYIVLELQVLLCLRVFFNDLYFVCFVSWMCVDCGHLFNFEFRRLSMALDKFF